MIIPITKFKTFGALINCKTAKKIYITTAIHSHYCAHVCKLVMSGLAGHGMQSYCNYCGLALCAAYYDKHSLALHCCLGGGVSVNAKGDIPQWVTSSMGQTCTTPASCVNRELIFLSVC